jgi:hypothetical protein
MARARSTVIALKFVSQYDTEGFAELMGPLIFG